jgi:AAA15 family ATPase/GTPase
MLKIKSLFLKNYAGFKDPVTFDFTNYNIYKPINMFFGPNGCGKSTALNAITLLGRAKAYIKRSTEDDNLLLRKLQFHPDYDPNYAGFTKYTDEMHIHGIFSDGIKDYHVEIINDDVVRNDLVDRKGDSVIFIDADNPLSTAKFQIPTDRSQTFITLAKAIYGYDCCLEKPIAAEGVNANKDALKQALAAYASIKDTTIKTQDVLLTKQEIYTALTTNVANEEFCFYQDFVINKGDVKVHYKSMSAGEKKIATLLRNLCDPTVIDRSDIVLVDNIELHVYFKRHKKMIDSILDSFPNKQFIVTSHSGIMIEHVGQIYGNECLYDIPVIKGQPLID